jgi:ClpX C4-type zinc finger protein
MSLMGDGDSEPRWKTQAAEDATERDALQCSFCGKGYAAVGTMVCGPTPAVAICNECVELCTEIMAEEGGGPSRAA